MRRSYYTLAVVSATLAVVAVACSHNHVHAPLVAIGLAALSATMWVLHRRVGAGVRAK